MSRREGRDSDSKRRRSRFDRQPSPKRSRWDDKPATDGPSNNINLDSGDRTEQDQKHRCQLQDAFPLEGPTTSDPKLEAKAVSKVSDNIISSHREGTKRSSDPTEVPRSRSYFQHDERGNAGQVGRSYSRKAETEHGWLRGSRDQQSQRAATRTSNETHKRDEKSQVRRDENRAWHHDRYFELLTDPKPPARKRPSFKEIKAPANTEIADEAALEPVKTSHSDHPIPGSERREEIGGQNSRYSDRPEKWNREANRGAPQRGYFSSRDRYGGGYSRGRERFAARRGYHQRLVHDKEWKHDLFEEANRSPTPKNEEDHIAKIEALLAS